MSLNRADMVACTDDEDWDCGWECFDDGYFELEKLEKGWPSGPSQSSGRIKRWPFSKSARADSMKSRNSLGGRSVTTSVKVPAKPVCSSMAPVLSMVLSREMQMLSKVPLRGTEVTNLSTEECPALNRNRFR